jgi:hypothetical protein
VKNIELAARGISIKMSSRFGLVTDVRLIKQLKAQHGTRWFTEDSKALSTLVVQNYESKVFRIDLSNAPSPQAI